MLKSYVVCDCCGKTLETAGVKAVQAIALTTLSVNGGSTFRSDVRGFDFCSSACLHEAINAALSKLVREDTQN